MSEKKVKKSPKKNAVIDDSNRLNSNHITRYSLLFFALAFLLYSPTINYGFVLDDVAVIEQNKFVQNGFQGIPDILSTFYWKGYWDLNSGLYRPLSLTMFAIEWAVSPENPMIHHFINVLLYAFSIGGLYRLLSRITPTLNQWVPVVVTALFMAHPSHTEVVANIKSRDEILAFLFLVLMLNALLNFFQANKKRHLIYSILFFTLGLFSKEGAITYLPLIFLFSVLLKNRTWMQSFKTTFPFLITAIIWLSIRYLVIQSDPTPPIQYTYLDNSLVACSDSYQLATGLGIVGSYFIECFYPINLSYDYSFNQIACLQLLSLPVIGSILVLLGLIFLVIKFWRSYPIVAFGSAFFLITIALVSNVFFLIGTTYANRLTFTPSLGILIVLVASSYGIVKKIRPQLTNYLHVAFLPVGLVYLLFTVQRTPAWESNNVLFETDVATAKNSARIHFNYGTSLMKKSDEESLQKEELLRKAIGEFQKAISIDSMDHGSYVNLGVSYYRIQNYPLSIRATKKAISLNPKDTLLYGNLGDAYFSAKQLQRAVEAYKIINSSALVNDTYLNKQGTAYFQLNDFQKALQTFEKGYELSPSNGELKMNLANVYGATGNYRKAAHLLEEIYNSNPSNQNALRLLRITLIQLGDLEKLKALETK